MDTVISLLRTRRSIRRYKNDPVPEDKVQLIKEALLRSPTSRNFMEWEFVLVDDRETLERLSRCKPHGSSFLGGAALAVVVCGDQTRSDVWVEDCSIAAILVQLTVHSLGLGSCWCQIRKRMHDENRTAEAYVRKTLDIPEKLRVECILGIGYPAEQKEGVDGDRLPWEKIRTKRYR